MSVVCFGEALIDFLSDGGTPESFTKYAGGAPANVSVAVAKQGVDSAFCGMLGDDMFGHFLKEELSHQQVNTQYVKFTKEAKTALAFVSLDANGERSFSFYRPPAADLLFRAEHFESDMFEQGKILHVCSNSLTEKNIYLSTVTAMEQAKNHGLIKSFDMNLRENLWPSMNHCLDRIWHIMTQADIVKLSKEELEFLNTHAHPSQDEQTTIEAILNSRVKLLLITDGANDIRYFSNQFSGYISPPKVNAVDTTAGGDAFVGGLLAELTRKLESIAFNEIVNNEAQVLDLVNFSAKCGAYAVTRYGAFASLPTKHDIG
ncbi:carbohydrate kinase family protein [Pseudoalteromonas obscura]|uniref:Carbohydrate kinase n=1 Tax=Pseudoalteromonas obscura TaxID=3048491 RepID=A0ABT7ENG3_9GAMM|nr:carbohydrate kinase [Pseudoalteromonas sp. P94(2023)]MDK2596589.1 carbohydrate kinase [Pseudoalteromonas sp. P94(2023)]